MPPKSQADILLDKAEKKLGKSDGWFSFASSTTKFEEAGDLFQQAANAYKIDREFSKAGEAFAKEAECRENAKESNDAANAFWNAAKAFKQAKAGDLAVQALQQTVVHLTKGGRFRQAADREKEIAQIYLQDGLLGKACESYVRAGDWYSQEDANATANACFKDAADLHAQLEEYGPAISRYEQVAEHSLSSALTKYSVKEYWLRAGLCALANSDTVTAKRNMSKYASLDVSFPTTREAKFINALIEAVEAGDQESFTAACVDFDKVMKLDNWKTSILLKIKKNIDEEPSLT
ncbi:vesicular-fusion protein SEC17 [Rickenella mellea]|uniref:Vesicular-fusion protein SEC17 n=1 Tax=Rickenella mellea TaxID=50990 RepID=A0A4Y7QML5_9AGAM|nr:vesicular-fusion protein SEC17 [Rickenella mellea]